MNIEQYERLRETVFDLMCGEVDVESIGIENEFRDGSRCTELYEKLYQHIEKLGDAQGCPKDAEQVQECYAEIIKLLCFKMYDYGWSMAGMQRSGQKLP